MWIWTPFLLVLAINGLYLAVHLMSLTVLCFKPSPSATGRWVAQVWTETEVCTGQDRYRQRFESRWQAKFAVKVYAMAIEFALPKTYFADAIGRYWNGDYGPYRKEFTYHFGLSYAVRELEPDEDSTFTPVLITAY